MEPIYEFDNKDIKEHSDSISHDCRLIEAQSISFLLYLDSQIEAEQDLVKKEKLKNALASLSSRVDETTKLKSELLNSYKEIDAQYTNLKKMGFGDIIDSYYATFGVSTNVKADEEVMVSEEVKEAVPEVVNEVTNEIPIVEEKVEEVPEMVANVPVVTADVNEVKETAEENVAVEEKVEEAPVAEANEPVTETQTTEEAAIEETKVADETPVVETGVTEAVEEKAEEVPAVETTEPVAETPIIANETATENAEEVPQAESEEPSIVPIVDGANNEEVKQETTEEPVIVSSEESNAEEPILTPANEGEAVEEPTLVPIVEETTTEGAAQEVKEEGVVPEKVASDVGDAVVEGVPAPEEIVVPAIADETANTEEIQETSTEGAVEETATPEVPAEEMELPKPEEFIPVAVAEKQEEVVADVPIPVVEEENVKPEEDNTQEAIQVAESAQQAVQTVENTEGLSKFVKKDNNPTSRILVTEGQYNALKQSLSRQEALLSARDKTQAVEVNEGAAASSEAVEDPQAKIEAMMEQANQLYQAGDTDGAQALYDQISIENEKLKEMQAVK